MVLMPAWDAFPSFALLFCLTLRDQASLTSLPSPGCSPSPTCGESLYLMGPDWVWASLAGLFGQLNAPEHLHPCWQLP